MRRRIYDNFLFILLGFGFYGVLKLLAPFAGALMAALICVVTFYPIYQALQQRIPHNGARAAVAEILVVLFFVIPITLLIWVSFTESTRLLGVLQQGSSVFTRWRDGDAILFPWVPKLKWLAPLGLSAANLKTHAILTLNHLLVDVSSSGTLILGHIVLFVSNIFVMFFAVFFLFRDGEGFYAYLVTLIPIRQQHKERLMLRMRSTVIAVVRGGFVTSLFQGFLATLGYLMVGAPVPILLGALTVVMGLVPVIGTAGVWGIVVAYYAITGMFGKAIFLFLWGALVVAFLVDVFVRPYLVGRQAQVPLFALFFALLGGLEVWGPKGLVLGPLLAALMPELLAIYRWRYLRQDE